MVLLPAILLIGYNNLINLLPEATHERIYVPLNVGVGSMLVMWARFRDLSWSDLGLSPRHQGRAVLGAALLGIALPSVLFLGLLLPDPVSFLPQVGERQDMSWRGLAYQTLVRIPFGTALFEEVAFRGVLYAVSTASLGLGRGTLATSVAFGLWHVTPTYELLKDSPLLGTPLLLGLGITGGVLATAVGGMFFAWLRQRSGSVYAPALTHWLINSVAATAAFVSSR